MHGQTRIETLHPVPSQFRKLIDSNGGLQIGGCLGAQAFPVISKPAIDVSIGGTGTIHCKSPCLVRDGLILAASSFENSATLHVHEAVARRSVDGAVQKRKGFRIVPSRLITRSQRLVGKTSEIVCIKVVALERDRQGEVKDGVGGLAGVCEGGATRHEE